MDDTTPKPPPQPKPYRRRKTPDPASGGVGGDVLAEAHATRLEVMRGEGGRNAQARLAAANAILAKDSLEHLSTAELRAHLARVVALLDAREPQP